MDCIKSDIIGYIERNLSEKRLRHTYAVADEAKKLARRYGADEKKAELAALFHDMCRSMPVEEADRYVDELGLPSSLKGNVNLAHSKVAAALMKRDFHIDDEDMINAVAFHTTGRAGMSTLEKIVFLADAIEPGRDYPSVKELRRLSYEDLDEACISSLSHTVGYVEKKGELMDPDTISALDYLKEKRNL